jgi:tape measure domain-containing protein
MAVTVERLIATLEARFDKYEKSLNRALGQTNQQFAAIERRGRQMESRMASIGGAVGRRFVAALAAGVSVRAFQQLSDAATRIDNALKVAGLSGEELEKVYGRLRDSAVRNAAPIEALVELYGRASLVQKELGISSEELLGFTDKIAVALRVSGKSAAESSGALLQLSQALGSGIVRAEEFNSILEGALPIAQAAARGLKEAGGSVAALRQLVVAGKVSSEAFFRAFEAGAPMLEEKVSGATFTIGQALGNLNTALVDAVREFNNSTGASESFAGGINNVAQAIADVDVAGFIQKIKDARSELEKFFDNLANAGLVERFAEAVTGLELTAGKPIDLDTVAAQKELANLERQIEILRQRIEANKEMAIDTSDAQAQLDSLLRQAAALRTTLAAPASSAPGSGFIGSPELPANQPKAPAAIEPVSLSDFKAPVVKGKGGGRGEKPFAREIRQIQERTAAIQAETAAQAGLNPLIDDYGYAVEKASAAQELLAAAKKEGIAITPQLKAQIDALAEGYASASVQAAQLAENQDQVRQAAEDFRALGKDVLGGFIDDLRQGKSGAEALANALNKVADKLLDMALNNLFSGGFGKGGLLGGFLIPGILHDGGVAGQDGYGHGRRVSPAAFAGARRYHSGGVVGGEVPAILRKGEIVDPGDGSVFRRHFGAAGGTDVVRVVLQDDSGRMADIADQQIRTRSGTIVQVSVQQSLKATRQQMPAMIANAQARQM